MKFNHLGLAYMCMFIYLFATNVSHGGLRNSHVLVHGFPSTVLRI